MLHPDCFFIEEVRPAGRVTPVFLFVGHRDVPPLLTGHARFAPTISMSRSRQHLETVLATDTKLAYMRRSKARRSPLMNPCRSTALSGLGWPAVLARTVKRAEQPSIEEMSQHDRDRSSLSVVQGQESRWLQLPRRRGSLPLAGHAGVHSRQHR